MRTVRPSATRGVHNSDQSSKRGEIGAGILYPENVVGELAKFHLSRLTLGVPLQQKIEINQGNFLSKK
jgi:hypothetical protein